MLSHLRNYVSAGVLTGFVGLISFPILTRNLSVAEYGIVGLVTASLTMFIAIGKMGAQHAVIRFYAQVKHGNIKYSMDQLYFFV
jgi:O-antigen/teichoic acid export membrane protein